MTEITTSFTTTQGYSKDSQDKFAVSELSDYKKKTDEDTVAYKKIYDTLMKIMELAVTNAVDTEVAESTYEAHRRRNAVAHTGPVNYELLVKREPAKLRPASFPTIQNSAGSGSEGEHIQVDAGARGGGRFRANLFRSK